MPGDFNLPTLKRNAEDMFLNYISQNDMSFFSTFASVGLTQIIRGGIFFSSGKALDLCHVLELWYSLHFLVVTIFLSP